jgi:hypothetical protein
MLDGKFEEVMGKERDMILGLVRPYMEILPCRIPLRFGQHWGLPAHFASSHPCQEEGHAGDRDGINILRPDDIRTSLCGGIEQEEASFSAHSSLFTMPCYNRPLILEPGPAANHGACGVSAIRW